MVTAVALNVKGLYSIRGWYLTNDGKWLSLGLEHILVLTTLLTGTHVLTSLLKDTLSNSTNTW